MATYQLPNIASQMIPNQNAPTSQLPDVPQYAPKENLGVQAIQAIGSVSGAMKAAAFKQAYGQAYANGDRQALIKLAANNPDQIQAIQQGAGFIDANNNQELGQAAAQLRVAGQQGPQAVAAVAQQHASVLQRIGLTPQSVTEAYQKDPNMLGHYADQIGMAALGPKDYFDQQDKVATQGITMRGQDLAAQTAANGQQVTMRGQDIAASTAIRGQNISASNSAADRQLKMLDLQLRQQQNTIDNAKTNVEIQNGQAKLAETQQKIQQVQQNKQQAVQNMQQASDLARSIASDPDLNDITGTVKGSTYTLRNSSQDLINKATQFQALLTGDNAKLLSGSLSDKDVMFLKQMATGLNIGDNGIKGSYQSTVQKLNTIADKLDTRLRDLQQPGTTDTPTQSPVTQAQPPAPQSNTVSWSQLP